MATEFLAVIRCDGCAKEISPDLILPPVYKDENGNEIHFCDHLCMIPFAQRRHKERMEAIRNHLQKNVDDWKINLQEDGADVEGIKIRIKEAEDILTAHLAYAESRKVR